MAFDQEGELQKWTNYYSGWQARYFTVKDGMLSYYACKADVVKVGVGWMWASMLFCVSVSEQESVCRD
jgi:hypothetical protein